MRKLNVIFSTLILLVVFGCGEEALNVTISTPTIQCGMCQRNIEMGLSNVSGISASKVDLATKVTKVSYNKEKIDLLKIEKAISDLGYQANKMLASRDAYETLPACCKVGGMEKI